MSNEKKETTMPDPKAMAAELAAQTAEILKNEAEEAAKKPSVPRKKTRKTDGKQGFLSNYIWEILAFLIPVVLMCVAFVVQKIYPVGTRQFLVTDNWHQYYPFFQLIHEKLQNGGSLLYSWRTGLGTNFLSLMAYYAASPLNLLSVFFPREILREVFTVLLLLKFGFAGLFFAKMLRYTFKKNDVSNTMFAVMYALCSYMLGYYWNTIWIDTVALMPLVMLGLVALVREGKYRTYVISLALAFLTNYYIAYFICIFTVLAFFCLCIFECEDFRTFGKRLGQVTGFSVLGAGISAWILIPTALALSLTHSANNTFPKKIAFYEGWRDIIANVMPYTTVTAKEGLPNIYCGWLPILLLGAFLIAKKIRIREKIAASALMIFLIVSCNMKTLNFIWHGFHFTNMLPYRFSFIFSFVVLVAAYRAFHVLLEEKFSFWQWGAMLLFGAAVCFESWGTKPDSADKHMVILKAAVLGCVYLIIILLRNFAPKQIVQFLLAVALCYEMTTHVLAGTKTVGSSDHVSYPAEGTEIAELMEYQSETDQELFCRTETTVWYTLNDPALYLYNGVSQFSSMANEKVSIFIREIGLPAAEGSNRYFYANTAPFTNMLLGIKYIIAKDGYNADTLAMKKLASSGSVAMYENGYFLPIGYIVDSKTTSYEFDDTENAFERQNSLFKRMTGVQEDLYTQVDITNVGHQGYDVIRNSYGNYSCTRQSDAGGDTYLKYNYTAPADGMMYGFFKVKNSGGDDPEKMYVYQNDTRLHGYNMGRQPYISPLCECTAGDKVTLRCDLSDKESNLTAELYVYYMNQDVLEKGYEVLKNRSLKLESFSDTAMSGTVETAEDGILYLSIPFDGGWTAYVDGKKAEIQPVLGAMSGIQIDAGSHSVRLRYSPRGFVPGLFITILSIGTLTALSVLSAKKKKSEETA